MHPRIRLRHSVIIPALTAAFALSASGCGGNADFTLIPLGMSDLDPAKPLATRLHAGECYYDLDASGRIRVALHYRSFSFFGEAGRTEVTLSLLLEEPPTGRARTYRLSSQSLRAYAQSSLEFYRFRSASGIAAVHDVVGDSLGGSFRCYVRHQRGNVVTGWKGDSPLLVLGRFQAVRNPAKTEELIRDSEAGGWGRGEIVSRGATSHPARTARP